MNTERKSGWIQTYTGIAFYPFEPRPDEILIDDIAHALSMLCRFAGHCNEFYSIAEHCVHITDWLPEEAKLAGLLHDASEAYLVDIPKPVKVQLPDYAVIEENLGRAIAAKFGYQFPCPAKVKEADKRILIDERNSILKTPAKAWDFEPEPLGIKIQCWSPKEAKEQFLNRYHTITQKQKIS